MYNLKIEIMRKMFIYLWVMICSLGFAACANDSGDDQAGESYKVSKITAHYEDEEDEDGDLVFKYNNQGKIIKCICDGDQITYTYKNDQIIINVPGDDDPTLELNEKGYVSRISYKDDDATTAYTYDASGQISKIDCTDDYSFYNFTWSEGNIVKVVYDNITATYTYSSVENKANVDFSSFLGEYFGDGYEYYGLFNGSYFGKQNKNLVTNCQEIENGEILNYRYEYSFNKNGCVEKISQYEDNVLTVTYTVEYL